MLSTLDWFEYQDCFDQTAYRQKYDEKYWPSIEKCAQRMMDVMFDLQVNKRVYNQLSTRSAAHQEWIIVTEPWCGDASESIPYLVALSEAFETGPKLSFVIRDDQAAALKAQFGQQALSMPYLIILEAGKVVYNWGPRPEQAMAIARERKLYVDDKEKYKMYSEKITAFYAEDQGQSLQQELLNILQ